jgi:hypothetical protein
MSYDSACGADIDARAISGEKHLRGATTPKICTFGMFVAFRRATE